MAKFDVSESLVKDNRVGRFLMGAIGNRINKDSKDQAALMARDENNHIIWDIKLIANGVELDFVTVLEEYMTQWDRCLKDEAKELIEDKLGQSLTALENISYEIRTQLKSQFFKKLDINLDEEY